MLNVLYMIRADGAEHTPSVFGFAPGVSFWTLVIFFALFAVLWKFAFPPILGYAEARERRIQEALDGARTEREEAERVLAQQRQELAEARTQAQQFIAEAKQDAERVRAELLERARAEQEEIVTRAKQDIGRERDLAVESVRREAVDLALAAAAQLIGSRVDDAADQRLVQEFLRNVPDSGSDARGAAT
ncbi:MAG: F0F1 ATP synthase subunit B [Gemmatimonadota bacterium]